MNRKEREIARDALLAQAVEEIKELKEIVEALVEKVEQASNPKTKEKK